MQYFNLHTHQLTDNPNVLALVNQYPWDFVANVSNYSIGIHPWYIDEKRLESDLEIMEEKLQSNQCLALGECGLDKRIEIPLSVQISVFEQQIALAERYQKPLVLHLVAAFDEFMAIKKRLKISVPIVIHGFSKNQQVAQQLLDSGCYLSFGKYLLRNPDLESVFRSVPNDRFFLETDTVEERIYEVYALAAKYKKMTLEELQKQIESNFKSVFTNNKILK